MAILFFDSSGLVKRYVAETGTAWVQGITPADAAVALAEINADFGRDFLLLALIRSSSPLTENSTRQRWRKASLWTTPTTTNPF